MLLHGGVLLALLVYRPALPLIGAPAAINVTLRGPVEQIAGKGRGGDVSATDTKTAEEELVQERSDLSPLPAESAREEALTREATASAVLPVGEAPDEARPKPVPEVRDVQPTVAARDELREAAERSDADSPPTESLSPDTSDEASSETLTAELVVPAEVPTVSPDPELSSPSAHATAIEPPAPERAAPGKLTMSAAHHRMIDGRAAEWVRALNADRHIEPSQSWVHDGQAFSASVQALPAGNETGLDRVMVEISTQVDGKRFATRMLMKRLAFSSYAQFVDRWDPAVQIHDDVIDGRFHSNSEIYVTRSRGVQPTFLGRVTTASRRINTSNSHGRVDNEEVFLGGLETGVRRIALPRELELFSAETGESERELHRFEEHTRIVFYPDGTYGWTKLESSESEQIRKIPVGGSYLAAAEKVRLHLRGVVRGAVLVYSPERISIEGNLTYARDPIIDPESEDFLGLVSDRSIEIAPPEVTGPGDLRIDGSIYARRRFAVKNFRSRSAGTLFLYGSLTAGSITATEPRFATRIEFDSRLENARPPAFPMTDRYELESWDRSWVLEPFEGELGVVSSGAGKN